MAQTQTTTTDSSGKTTIRTYVDGVLTRETYTTTSGESGQSEYRNGSRYVTYITYANGSRRTINADGSSEYSETNSRGTTTWYTNAAGRITGSASNYNDGSSRREQRNADGTVLVYENNANGTRSEYTTQTNGNASEKRYNAAGVLVSQTNTRPDGWRENISYNANGTVNTRYVFGTDGTTTTYYANGSYESTSKNAAGQTITTYFNASGTRTGRAVEYPDGSTDRTEFGANGAVTTYNRKPNGSYSVVKVDAAGNTSEQRYNTSNQLVSESAVYANGGRMNASYNPQNGSYTKYEFLANGNYKLTERNAAGTVTSQWYNANNQPINNGSASGTEQADALVIALASFGTGAGGDASVTVDQSQSATILAGSLS